MPASNDPDDIYNWQRLDATITTSGQPSEAQLAAIRELGVTHVVNLGLHSHEHALADEAASVAALGMRYTHIPVAFEAPTDEDFARFCAVMASAGDEPTHVHCIANMRVSAFFYRYRRDFLGWDEAVARVSMESIWRPGGVWASFIGDEAASELPHRGPIEQS
jgi:protein tyrosine phosphatase (PTP) superfamily phosphohydrolase (DUF442 family)